MKKVLNNGLLYFINALFFIHAYSLNENYIYVIILMLFLMSSFLLYKSEYSLNNIFIFGNRRIENIGGIILSFLFLFNLILFWGEFKTISKLYIVLFVIIQMILAFPAGIAGTPPAED